MRVVFLDRLEDREPLLDWVFDHLHPHSRDGISRSYDMFGETPDTCRRMLLKAKDAACVVDEDNRPLYWASVRASGEALFCMSTRFDGNEFAATKAIKTFMNSDQGKCMFFLSYIVTPVLPEKTLRWQNFLGYKQVEVGYLWRLLPKASSLKWLPYPHKTWRGLLRKPVAIRLEYIGGTAR